jgi:phosphatidyl-myo-inositol dimannoside synthase
MPLAKRIVFAALETYSLIGGLQNFNRRLIIHLGRYAAARGDPPPLILLFGDEQKDVPDISGVEIEAFGPSRRALLMRTIEAVTAYSSLFIVGHINLVPVAFAARAMNLWLPTLLMVHGDEVWNDPDFRPMRWSERFTLKAIDHIGSVSEFTARVMGQEFNISRSKFRLMPNAVDLIADTTRRCVDDVPTVLTVSRLGLGDRYKHIDKVIRAVARLRPALPAIFYEIVGDGGLRPELESLATELGVSDCVRFLGHVSDAERETAYSRAHVFVLPSSKEGFGIVYLEAWQHEVPVICSVKGASGEIIEDGIDGFAVDPDDVAVLAERIQRLLVERDLAVAFGHRGRKKVLAKYLDIHFGENLANLIDGCLGRAVA